MVKSDPTIKNILLYRCIQ